MTSQLLAAVKYVAIDELAVLAQAGISLVGENRAQELERKAAAPGGEQLTWDFIGHLQSRKVKTILPLVRMIHSVGSDSVVEQLGRHATARHRRSSSRSTSPARRARAAIAPAALDDFLDRCREVGGVEVAGLMTMPPLASDPEDSRRWFAALAELAAARGLRGAVDGHHPGLRRGRRGGRHDRASRHEAVPVIAGDSPCLAYS